MTPGDYEFRLIDLNCEPLKDSDLEWADMVLFSAMLPQRKTLFEAAKRLPGRRQTCDYGRALSDGLPRRVQASL